MAWTLIADALSLFAARLGVALRLSIAPLIVLGVAIWGLFTLLGVNLPMIVVSLALMRVPPQVSAALVLSAVLVLLVLSWIAVGWYRSVLGGVRPGLWPDPSPGRVGRYALRMMGLSLLLAPAVILADLLLQSVAQVIALPADPPFGWVVPVLLQTLTQWLIFRLGLGLPGQALDRPVPLRESWALTEPLKSPLAGAAAILGLIALLPSALLDLAPVAGMPRLLLTAGVFWLLSFLGLAALATVYRRIHPNAG